jgi:glycosyltransferase involved in cell wall biosynthesis
MNNVIVAQLGARMHYAVPRMFQAGGRLEHFYTDICAVKGWPRYLRFIPSRLRPAPVKRLLGRVPLGVPPARISAFAGLGREYSRRCRAADSPSKVAAACLWAGKTLCQRVIEQGLDGADGVYTFNIAGLELLRHARRRGWRTMMEQTIAPKRIELELLRAEHAAFPFWRNSIPDEQTAAAFIAREEAEWQESDLILCGSDFVRAGIARCGGPSERCVVVPYGVDAAFHTRARQRRPGPLRVLTVGEIGLRKGSPHVLTAAKMLGDRARFRIVGNNQIGPQAARRFQKHVEMPGPAPRSEIFVHYAWADVFLLPSLCEGSATVTYEALACGLPVITTPNAGSIVRDGTDGFIVPIRDGEAIAEKIELLLTKPCLLAALSDQARQRARDASLAAYAQRFNQAIPP